MGTGIKYQKANVKLKALARKLARKKGRRVKIYGTSLPSGFACPGALDCMSKADRVTGKITDGLHTKYRCFTASLEALSPQLRALAWNNFDILRKARTREAMADALDETFPLDADAMRPGLGGDFFNSAHFAAWMDVARRHPDTLVYCYTKSINYWVEYTKTEVAPDNVEINGSSGGRHDALLAQHKLKTAFVVFHPKEAEALGLEIDHDETHAIEKGPSFALLLHGTQPKGSKASQAEKQMRAEGIEYAYRS